MRLRDVGAPQLFVNFGDTGLIVRAFVAAGGSSIAPVHRLTFAGHLGPLHIRKLSPHTVLPAKPLTGYTVVY
jgi:hypothetical protein